MNDTPLPNWEIIHGDTLKVLGRYPPGTFDAVITDPPYSSGGRTQAEKSKSTVKKYSSMGDYAPPPFDGDAKDQRSWTRWSAEWLYDARRARLFVCLLTGGSCLPPRMRSSEQAGSGVVPPSGTRETAVRSGGAFASKRNILSGVLTAIWCNLFRYKSLTDEKAATQ